jgi:capsular polysaccharide biosynthesis protein
MNKIKKMWATAVVFALGTVSAFAQSGVNGLTTATSTLKTYVAPVTNITLVIGGIVGIVGAIRVYSKWN